MLRLKRNMVGLILALMALWPAVHFGLYRAYHIDPWKLCGWAMYARPHPTYLIGHYRLGEDHWLPEEPRSEAVIREMHRVSRRYRAFGTLQSLDSLGEVVLAERSDWDAVRFVVRRFEFDCGTASMDYGIERTYEYRR